VDVDDLLRAVCRPVTKVLAENEVTGNHLHSVLYTHALTSLPRSKAPVMYVHPGKRSNRWIVPGTPIQPCEFGALSIRRNATYALLSTGAASSRYRACSTPSEIEQSGSIPSPSSIPLRGGGHPAHPRYGTPFFHEISGVEFRARSLPKYLEEDTFLLGGHMLIYIIELANERLNAFWRDSDSCDEEARGRRHGTVILVCWFSR
jgi:hypothetical protein